MYFIIEYFEIGMECSQTKCSIEYIIENRLHIFYMCIKSNIS